MSEIKNIEDCPNPLNGVYNPSVEMKYAAGYRHIPTQPELSDGMTRLSALLVEGDGQNAAWEVVDMPTVEVEAAQAAAHKAANLKRWILENAFIMVCQQYFGTLEKRGTKELLAKAFELVDVNQKAAMTAFGVVIGLDKELVRVAGDLWWDECEWHQDADAIAGAAQYLGVTP